MSRRAPTPYLFCTLVLTLCLSACSERESERPEPPAASEAEPAPLTDQWAGQWDGPEGTFLRITGSQGHYDVTIQTLDGPRTYAGTAKAGAEAIEFQRDGQTQTLRATNGEQTGMKWLAGKTDCLTVRSGEGYCRE
jgi:hypothetical protein